MTDILLPEGIELKHPNHLYIDGQWVAPEAGGTLEVVSPDTEQVVARAAEATAPDMDKAVAAARKAFDTGVWHLKTPAERAAGLRKMGEYLQQRLDQIAKVWSIQMGGPAGFAPIMMGGATQTFLGMADLGEHFEFEAPQQTQAHNAGVAIVAREPVGVVVAIAPWNAPYPLMLSKVGSALMAGCPVIMKPAPETPLDAYFIAEAAEYAGIPAGVVNLVPAQRDASDHLVRNPGVDKVAFTGSTAAGGHIASVCGERIARCTLELGGKSAAIVLDDFPIEGAAKLLAHTICMMSGQVCAILSRVIVPRHRHDELADAIAAEMKQIRIGHSTDPEAQLGPVAMKRQLERIESYIEIGKQEGATLVTGGKRPEGFDTGYFFEPTLFANVDNSSRIAQEEIFGPVLCLIPCEDEADAIRIANDSDYGLNSAVLTTDVEAAYRVGKQLRAGISAQGGMCMDESLPFGGFKKSGIGREGGVEGLMSYLETHVIFLSELPARFK